MTALSEGKIQDEFVDQHFITEFLMYSSEREKMSSRGVAMPGTRVGSVSLVARRDELRSLLITRKLTAQFVL